jgi:membrane protein
MAERSKTIVFLQEVYSEWRADNALTQGAALAYYTIFSMAPLLMLVVAIAGLALGRSAAQGELVERIRAAVGPEAGRVVAGVLEQVSRPSAGVAATVISVVTMLIGASSVFGQLQSSLNLIWGVDRSQGGLRHTVQQRLATFLVVVGIGVLLLASMLLTAVVAAVQDTLAQHLPALADALPGLNLGLSFLVTTTFFAMIYKVLPATHMRWSDVWLGGAFTALLFTVGKTFIGLYLGRTGVTSVYGAAGSLVLLLLWIYYSAQIFMIGAEFTEVYSRRFGSRREESAKDTSSGQAGQPA